MSLGDLVKLVSSRYPDKGAIKFGEKSWNYLEFDEITDLIAAALIQVGVQTGDRIALHLSNCPELVFCYYACFKIGAIAVPINTRLKSSEIQYILNHCQAKICISQVDLFLEIQLVRENLPKVERYYLLGDTAPFSHVQPFTTLLQQSPHDIKFPQVNDDAIATILYTSGTTAQPKGVTHTHYSLQRTGVYHAQQVGLDSADISGVMLPMCHIFGFALQVIASVSVGATLVIIPHFDPALVLQNLQQHQVTKLYGLPVMYNALVNYLDAATYHLDALQVCFAGGDAVPVTLQQKFQQLTTGVELIEGCGMTEVIPYAMNPLNGSKKVGSIGKPAIGMQLRLVDENGKDVSQGEIGEILVKTDAMMLEYWENPEATAATIQDGWLHTGDLATKDEDGYYWFVSRKKEIIIRGGSNISPLEVEAVLYQHPAVREAAVIGVPDQTWGEVVQAFVVLHQGYSINKTELQEFVKQRIAVYKVPQAIAFLPELPKGLTGKIHRQTLRNWATAQINFSA
jgi:acyl-CoA synthetase (AMP-forming)/AMP-acid ligase II